MNENVVKDVFSVYEVLKDSIKVARRSINNEIYTLHSRTIFWGEKKDVMLDLLSGTEEELDDIMILSLFASFERELRVFIQGMIDVYTSKPTMTIARIMSLATNSIERWAVNDMIEVFSDVVDVNLRGQIKQIYEYRNWVAHGKSQNKLPSASTDPKTVQISLINFITQAKLATLNASDNAN